MADAPPPDAPPADAPAEGGAPPEGSEAPAAAAPPAAAPPASPPTVVSERNQEEFVKTIRAIQACPAGKPINDEEILQTREKYTILRDKEVASGASAKLYAATSGADTLLVKISPIQKLGRKQKENLMSASLKIITHLAKVRPKNIVVFHSAYVSPQKIYVFSEYCKGGDIWKYAKERARANKLTEDEIKPWIRNIADGLQFLNVNGIGHRNLSSESVVLTDDRSAAKISCFGHSMITYDPNAGIAVKSEKNNHIECFYAPETLKGMYDPHPADVWSVGAIIGDCLTGKHYIFGKNEKDYETTVRNHFRKNLVQISQLLDAALKRILEVDPAKRASPQELLAQVNWLM